MKLLQQIKVSHALRRWPLPTSSICGARHGRLTGAKRAGSVAHAEDDTRVVRVKPLDKDEKKRVEAEELEQHLADFILVVDPNMYHGKIYCSYGG